MTWRGRSASLALVVELVRLRPLAFSLSVDGESARAAPGLTIYADGEFVGIDECTITVRPATLRIIVPNLANS